MQWETTTTDINGLIRSDGKQLASEIGLTLVNCEPYLSAEDLLFLTNMKLVIDDQIDKNIKLSSTFCRFFLMFFSENVSFLGICLLLSMLLTGKCSFEYSVCKCDIV